MVSTLLICSRKISTVGIHGQGGQENSSDVQGKSLLGIWLQLCELEFAFEQTQVSCSAICIRTEATSHTTLLE